MAFFCLRQSEERGRGRPCVIDDVARNDRERQLEEADGFTGTGHRCRLLCERCVEIDQREFHEAQVS